MQLALEGRIGGGHFVVGAARGLPLKPGNLTFEDGLLETGGVGGFRAGLEHAQHLLLQLLRLLQLVATQFEQLQLLLVGGQWVLKGLQENEQLGQEGHTEQTIVQLQCQQTVLAQVLWVLQLDLRIRLLHVQGLTVEPFQERADHSQHVKK